jgi:outer membrane protein OmpA-like peptidoglycan-associated protein
MQKRILLPLLFFTCFSTGFGQTKLIFTFYFPFDGSCLTKQEQLRYETLLPANKNFILKGYADTIGSNEFNRLLSVKRLQSVQQFIKKKSGIRIQDTFSYGEHFATGNGPVSDRRVEIWLQENKTGTASENIKELYSFPNIFFLPYQATVRKESLENLENLYKKVQTIKTGIIEIRGHINWPISGPNKEIPDQYKPLSEARAKAIYDYLIQKGVAPERLRYVGLGNTEMLYPNAKTETEMFQNMRVELAVIEQ